MTIDLTGQVFGRLTVIGRADHRAKRGKRTVSLWKCLCECGETAYRASDSLKSVGAKSMCKQCARNISITKARNNAGFCDGTQTTKLKVASTASHNISGVRGVYYERQQGRYRARIRFKGKLYNLGSYNTLQEAIAARKRGEEEIFEKYLATRSKGENHEESN